MALNLMCASGADVSDATAMASNVLDGKTFYAGADDNIKTGTMPSYGYVNEIVQPGQSYKLNAGYYSGGLITANQWNSSTYLIIMIQFQGGYANGYIPEHAAVLIANLGYGEVSILGSAPMAGNISGQSNICNAGMLSMTTEWGNYQYANCQALTKIYDTTTSITYPSGTIIHLNAGLHVFRKA